MGLYDAMNNSPKEKKEKTLLKDVKGEHIGVVRTGYNENRPLAREYGEETFYKPGKTYLISTEGGDSAKGWEADMAENREEKDKLFKKSGSDVAVYGVKVAEDDRRLPESIAYRDFDSTMPKKQQTPVAQPTPAVTPAKETSTPVAQAPAVKEEVPATAPTPAAVAIEAASQKEETPAAQSRYDKAIAYINEASKAPSWRERRDIRKMEKAAKKLIEDGEIRIETEPIAFERDLEEVEIIADKNPTPQTPAVKEEVPATAPTPAEQPTATTTQQEAAKDEVPAQPASTAQQTTKAPAATENAAGANPWKHTKNWWQPSTYVQDEEAYHKLILEQQRREERNEKRRRNRALIADLVNMGVALGSTAGGAVAVPEVPILSKKSNDKLHELREKQAALQLEFAKNMHKARQLDAQDFAKRVKAEVDAEKEANKAAETKEYRDKRIALEKERIELAKNKEPKTNKESSGSKDTWIVEGKTYTDVFDAWVALPEDAKMDEEGNVKVSSTTQMKADLAMYKKNKEANKKTNKQQTNSKKTTTSNSSPQQAKEGNREPKKKEDKVGSSAMADLVKKAEEIMNNTPPSRR